MRLLGSRLRRPHPDQGRRTNVQPKNRQSTQSTDAQNGTTKMSPQTIPLTPVAEVVVVRLAVLMGDVDTTPRVDERAGLAASRVVVPPLVAGGTVAEVLGRVRAQGPNEDALGLGIAQRPPDDLDGDLVTGLSRRDGGHREKLPEYEM